MEIVGSKRLLVLVVVLGLVATAAVVVYGKNVEEVSKGAGEESWTDWAKQKLRVVTDTTSKESDANMKDAKGATSKASDTASVYWQGMVSRYNAVRDGVNEFTQGLSKSGKANANEASSQLQEGYKYVKKSSNEVAAKAYETAKATMDKAYETAGVTSGKAKESSADAAAGGKTQAAGVFESTKQKLGEQYEAAKEVVNEQMKTASKLANDVGQHVKHMAAGHGHEEL